MVSPHSFCATVLAASLGASVAAQDPVPDPRSQPPQEGGRQVRGQDEQHPGQTRKPPGVPREQIAAGGWPIMEWRQATGDWGGARDWLHEHGIDPEVFLTIDSSVVASGGVDRGATSFRALLDATVTVDGEQLLGWHGARFFADFQVQRGGIGSTDTGDLQGYSNIDSDNRTQLALLWYEQELFDHKLRIKVGKADANTDFAFVENGFRFINSSFGYSPTILGLPSYPDAAFGLLAFVRPGGGFYAGAGVYDGAGNIGRKTGQRGPRTLFGEPSDLFVIAEVGRRWLGSYGPGRIGFGASRHTGDFARFDGGVERGTDSAYLIVEQMLWQPKVSDDARRGVRGFAQYGWADENVSAIEHHFGTGASWTGPFEQRPRDAVGIGASWASFTDEQTAGLRGSSELAVEMFYSLQVTPWIRIKPDVQYIHNPGGLGVDDALAFTLRMAITF